MGRWVTRPVVFVAGPISDKGTLSHAQQKQNVEMAVKVGLRLLALGFAPIIPHLSWFADPHNLFSDDWYKVDHEFIRRSDALLRLPGASWGANIEVELAKNINVPVLYSIEEVIRWHEAANGSTNS